MAFVTPRMSLKVWTSASDPYDHEQLADNFLKLDLHDHSQGKGTAIPGSGIQPGAITADHIYPGAVQGVAIGDNSVGTAQIQDEAVGNTQLAINARLPVGTVMDWYCADPAQADTYLPDGWRVCDGTNVAAGQHEIPGADPALAFTLPNLIGKATIGASTASALNGGTDTTPGVGKTGGEVTHTLTVAEMPSHTHPPTSPATGFQTVQYPGSSALSSASGSYTPNDYDTTGPAGGGGAHNNMQPYYGLLKIMKVKNA
jgi:microcystin-dependent protein